MELRHLRYFMAVAEEMNFTRAAKRLHIAQPPLSQQIRKLEEELQVLLFFRTKRRIELTHAGRVFLEETQRILQSTEQAVHAARQASRGEIGRLVIGFMSSAPFTLLPSVLRSFREHSPGVGLTLHELPIRDQIDALRKERIDVGFLRPPLAAADLASETIVREPFVVAVPAQHPLAKQASISIKALAGEPLIMFPQHLGPEFHGLIIGLCQQGGFSPTVAQEATEMHTVVGLVSAGIGIAVVPASVQRLRLPEVVYRTLKERTPYVQTIIAWRASKSLSPVLHSFLNIAKTAAKGYAHDLSHTLERC